MNVRTAPTDLPRSRRFAFAILASSIGLIVALVVVEGVARAVRVTPEPLDIIVEPGGKYQAPDPVLGFRPLPGTYRALFAHRYPWQFTNLLDTTRVTRPIDRYEEDTTQPGVWVFGCSFVQGWGLNDDETLPWKLQERLPEHDVMNFGVGGYGTLQSLLQFRRALAERRAPAIAILAYADFHDARNVRTSAWRDANFSYERFGTTAQPFARLDASGALRYEWGDNNVPFMWLRAHSAAFDVAAVGYGSVRDASLRAHEVSELLIEQFIDESRRHGVRFVLAGIWPSDVTRDTLRRFGDRGVLSTDVAVDYEDERNKIPYDGHPSAFANEQQADRLVAALHAAGIVADTSRAD